MIVTPSATPLRGDGEDQPVHRALPHAQAGRREHGEHRDDRAHGRRPAEERHRRKRQIAAHRPHQWLSIGTAVILFGLLVAGFLLHADERNGVGLDALSVVGITTALAGFVAFDQFRKNPVSDPQLLIGIAFTPLVFALNTIAGWLRKAQK